MRTTWPFLMLVAVACGGEAAREGAQVEQQAPVPQAPAPEAPPAPPAYLAVSPRSVAFDAIGDTVRLVLPAGADCQSALPSVATVDPAGLVRALSNGVTHLRCWGDDATATVRVAVDQEVARVSITADLGFEIARAGDTLRLGLARVDRLGTTVETARPQWASLQPEVVSVDAVSGIAVGVADSGTARVIAQVDGHADTVTVELGRKVVIPLLSQSTRSASSRAARAAALRRASPTARRGASGPVADRRFAGNEIGVREVRPADSLNFQDPAASSLSRRARTLIPYAVATLADHGVTDEGGQPLERSSGVMFGVGADVITRGWLRASFQVSTGTLAAQTPAARDQTVTDGRFDMGIAAFTWLTLNVGVQSRVYSDISTSQWIMVRTGGDLRFNLGDTPLTGLASLNLLPYTSRGEGNTSPNFGMATAFGMGFERGRFNASIKYFIETYGFPAQAGVAAREEQFSGLELRLGLLFGW